MDGNKVTCCNKCPYLGESYMPMPGPLRYSIWRYCQLDGTFLGKYTALSITDNIPVPNWCPDKDNDEDDLK